MRKMKIIAALATGLALAGCSSLTGPAGEGRNSHLYGVATAQNINAQIAYGDPASRIRALNEAFRAAARDTVTFNFDGTALDSAARAAPGQQVTWSKAHQHVRLTVRAHADHAGTDAVHHALCPINSVEHRSGFQYFCPQKQEVLVQSRLGIHPRQSRFVCCHLSRFLRCPKRFSRRLLIANR